MARRKTHAPLNVLINNRLVGRLEKEPSGAVRFQYDQSWLDWEHHFPISRSMPARRETYSGETVNAVFDNLLPDNDSVRKVVAERTGAQGTDSYSLLEQIGRDCVGALQFLPEGTEVDPNAPAQGVPLSDEEIERTLASLGSRPLGIDPEPETEFRISVAGAQEKTALLRMNGKWFRPIGTTPTTHILKPQLGKIHFEFGTIDLTNSVENEHYCLKVMEAFGLKVASTEIATFGERKVLVVERFDRTWRGDRLIRLPQEDCCQALGFPSSQKYQSAGGPSAVAILKLLRESDEPARDQIDFLKSQMVFWLTGATDGHAKNYSIFLRPGGRFELTPFYDVLSAQPAVDAKALPHRKFTLAMSEGDTRHYKILTIHGRHFRQTAKAAGLGDRLVKEAIDQIEAASERAADEALAKMPEGFHEGVHESIARAIRSRVRLLHAVVTED